MEAIEATETPELESDHDNNNNNINPTMENNNHPSLSSSIMIQKEDVIRAVEIVERDSLAIAESFSSLFQSLRTSLSTVTSRSVDHVQCFSDAAGRLQESGIAHGTSEGLERGIDHGTQGKSLSELVAYDPDSEAKYHQAHRVLKELKYTVADEIEALVDAPFNVLAAKLTLAEPVEGVASPSVDQLKVPACPPVYSIENPWRNEVERRLDVVVGTNLTHKELRNKRRTVCAAHSFGSSFHSRTDGLPMAVPSILRKGLKIFFESSVEVPVDNTPFKVGSSIVDGTPRKVVRTHSFPDLMFYHSPL